MLQLLVLLAQRPHLAARCLALGVAHQPALARLEEVLAPVVVEVRTDPLAPAQLGDRLLALQALEHDADLVLAAEATAGAAANLPNPGFGLTLLGHRTLLS